MGVLYLENNLAPGVFTPNRLAILELLASQAAISLDHARLYADLIQENNERRKAEEALRASEERWSVLAENSSAGIALIAPNGRFIAANLALQEMLGYTESELQGRTATDISHEEDRASTEARIADVYAGRRRVYRLEKRYLRKNGNVMWADVSSVLVPASGSVSAFFSVIIVDITKRKQAEEKLHQKEISLREAQTELAHVSRVTTMGELAASIAHEVNQPLAGILTNANASLRWLSKGFAGHYRSLRSNSPHHSRWKPGWRCDHTHSGSLQKGFGRERTGQYKPDHPRGSHPYPVRITKEAHITADPIRE